MIYIAMIVMPVVWVFVWYAFLRPAFFPYDH